MNLKQQTLQSAIAAAAATPSTLSTHALAQAKLAAFTGDPLDYDDWSGEFDAHIHKLAIRATQKTASETAAAAAAAGAVIAAVIAAGATPAAATAATVPAVNSPASVTATATKTS